MELEHGLDFQVQPHNVLAGSPRPHQHPAQHHLAAQCYYTMREVVCAAQEFMTPEFKKQWFRKKAHELPADAELVSCVPLGLVLEMFGISHIDFLSLDVEVMHGKPFLTKLGGPRTGHLLDCRIHSTSMLSVHRCCIPSHCPD